MLRVIYTGDRKQRPEYTSLSEEYFGGRGTAVDGMSQSDTVEKLITLYEFDERESQE